MATFLSWVQAFKEFGDTKTAYLLFGAFCVFVTIKVQKVFPTRKEFEVHKTAVDGRMDLAEDTIESNSTLAIKKVHDLEGSMSTKFEVMDKANSFRHHIQDKKIDEVKVSVAATREDTAYIRGYLEKKEGLG